MINIIYISLLISFLLVSCGLFKSEENEASVKRKSTVSIKLIDGNTKTPINNAFVLFKEDVNDDGTFENSEETEYFCKEGSLNILDNPKHLRLIKVEAPGYVTYIKRIGKGKNLKQKKTYQSIPMGIM